MRAKLPIGDDDLTGSFIVQLRFRFPAPGAFCRLKDLKSSLPTVTFRNIFFNAVPGPRKVRATESQMRSTLVHFTDTMVLVLSFQTR